MTQPAVASNGKRMNGLKSSLQTQTQRDLPLHFFFCADITTKLKSSSCLLLCSGSNPPLSLNPNSRLLCDVLLCLTDSLFPSGCCQANVWSRLMLRAARCIFSLSSPIFKQQQPPVQLPEGMCANSYSPVGSIAITAPLLYPCNCIGSCFLSDQTVSQPPRETRFITLNKGCFFYLFIFNRAWGFIFWPFAPLFAVLYDGWDRPLEDIHRTFSAAEGEDIEGKEALLEMKKVCVSCRLYWVSGIDRNPAMRCWLELQCLMFTSTPSGFGLRFATWDHRIAWSV